MSDDNSALRIKYAEKVHKGLDRAYKNTQSNASIDFDLKTDRCAILSDQHKGIRDGADDFKKCARVYNAALGYYYEAGYKLVLLGDSEELWECKPREVLDSHKDTLGLEAKFNSTENRCFKIIGNHDECWGEKSTSDKYLDRVFKTENGNNYLYNSLTLMVHNNGTPIGKIFMLHGHQGTLESDMFSKISKFLVRNVWRNFQRLTKIKSTMPSSDFELRGHHNRAMYDWAHDKCAYGDKLILIAGHTHLPVFISQDIVGKLQTELDKMKRSLNQAKKKGRQAYRRVLERIAEKSAELEYAKASNSISMEMSGTKPCYFNTGCCSFSDGDITAIEIADGEIRLVRLPDKDKNPRRLVLDKAKLETEVFKHL